MVENTNLRVKGRLIVRGNQSIITLTSVHGAPKPEQYWECIIIESNSSGSVINCTKIEFANYGRGIKIGEESMSAISYNEITFNGYDGIYVGDNSRPTITNNAITSTYNNGIKCMGSSTPIIINNLILRTHMMTHFWIHRARV